VFHEISANKFTFANFYKRRVARLLPALVITLIITWVFGFLFYSPAQFDNLGKEIFFSALGAANLLFARGVNYFSSQPEHMPLVHLWSLGVEEQFYLVWPFTLILLARFRQHVLFIATLALALISLLWSEYAIGQNATKAYFHPQYRAFELLLGALVAFHLRAPNARIEGFLQRFAPWVSLLGAGLVLVPMFVLDEQSRFPGFNALWPTLGTAMLLLVPNGGLLQRGLSLKPMVLIGLISYPLYLYHQLVITGAHLLASSFNHWQILLLTLVIATPAAWLTYQYIETPIRKRIKQPGAKRTRWTIGALVVGLAGIALVGMMTGVKDGLGWRYQLLNPFAFEVIERNELTFHQHLPEGYNAQDQQTGRVLFVGDSVLQHYVYPFTQALSLEPAQVDTASRGGCIMLKDVEFDDPIADFSCKAIRRDLYASDKRYELVVISQRWNGYEGVIRNQAATEAKEHDDELIKWQSFIDGTVKHFAPLSDRIVIVAGHPLVKNTPALAPTVFLKREDYQQRLAGLVIANHEYLDRSRAFFERWQQLDGVDVVYPRELWCEERVCTLHDGQWSYFVDGLHVSESSTERVANRFRQLLERKN